MKRVFAVILGLLVLSGSASAQSPVAVVEDVQGKVTGAEFMDYVAPGQVIKLGAGGKVVLGYMKSCARETISGIGTVIVGKEQSAVHLADYQVDKVACDVSQTDKIGREVSESAATVVRSVKPDPSAPLVLYGTSPVVMTEERGRLVVERLDAKGERYEVDLNASTLTRGKFYDLAKTNTALKPGGTYAATLKTKRVVFQIDARAGSGAGPVIGRLVSLR